jgi:hypothetical protein
MNVTAAEIENIVRRVLGTLTDGGSVAAAISEAPSTSAETLQSNESVLRINSKVISVQLLQKKLTGIAVLAISENAVVTPAARDYCKENGVQIVRGSATIAPSSNSSGKQSTSSEPSAKPTRPQRLIVDGSASWIAAISKQLCPKQANVLAGSPDDLSTMRHISDGLRAGHQGGLAVVESPHAACWQAARDDRLRPVVLSNWSELNDVLREVPVNLLILSAKSWNVPSVCNVARRWHQHLQSHS